MRQEFDIEPVLNHRHVLGGHDEDMAANNLYVPELLEILPIAVYTCNAQGYITFYNKAAVELWGREPVIGKDQWCGSWKIYQVDGITLLPLDECPMARTLRKARSIVGEEIIIERPDGLRRVIRPHPIPQFDKTGKLTGAVNTLVDITEQKGTEKYIAKLAAIVESSDDAIISKTLTGVITSWNNSAERIFGYTADEMIGQPVTRIIPVDRIDEETIILQRLKRGERIEHFETQRISKNKKILDISLTISPIKDKKGRIIGVSKIARDLTQQKWTEKMVHEKEEQFRITVESTREKILENELLLKTISNAAPVGLWMTDTEAQNTFVNETWVEWTGIPFEKHLGAGWLECVLNEDKKDVPSKFRDCVQRREKYSTEFRIIRKDGEWRWCLTEGTPFYDINGEFAGYAGSVTDITEIKKLEERKDEFITMASHELITPITSIKGYVQLLMNIYNELNADKLQAAQPTVKSSLTTISKQVSKLSRLISELLDLSRIESGKLELRKTVFNLMDMVEDSVHDVSHTTSKLTFNIRGDFTGDIYADKDRISQVLLNLLTNAIKYSPEPGYIDVCVNKDGESVIIRVEDQGIGIDKKDHRHIFDRFYRVEGKSEQTYPGFGIGLFIVNEIVSKHHGSVFVESEKGKGSVFAIRLPVIAPEHNKPLAD